MKAISIKQPWAWLIVNGFKDIENRTWRTNNRGRFLIHASKKIDKLEPWQIGIIEARIGQALPETFDLGGIVGEVEIADVVTKSDSPWFVGPIGFTLKDAKPLPFRAMNGKLGFFEVAELEEA